MEEVRRIQCRRGSERTRHDLGQELRPQPANQVSAELSASAGSMSETVRLSRSLSSASPTSSQRRKMQSRDCHLQSVAEAPLAHQLEMQRLPNSASAYQGLSVQRQPRQDATVQLMKNYAWMQRRRCNAQSKSIARPRKYKRTWRSTRSEQDASRTNTPGLQAAASATHCLTCGRGDGVLRSGNTNIKVENK